MDIKTRLQSAILLALVLLTGFQCSNDSKLLESIPESSYINNCPDVMYPFGEMVSVGDPNEKFMIRLPYSWDIRESYGDSLYGVFASNFLSVPKPREEQMSLSVTGYSTTKEIEQYYHDEVLELIKDDHARVLERGTTMLDGKQNPWVLFELQGGIYNMVYYVKDLSSDDVFLVQAVTYDTVNYKTKMCHLKQLVKSFERVRY
jgi:hypothetical protein